MYAVSAGACWQTAATASFSNKVFVVQTEWRRSTITPPLSHHEILQAVLVSQTVNHKNPLPVLIILSLTELGSYINRVNARRWVHLPRFKLELDSTEIF